MASYDDPIDWGGKQGKGFDETTQKWTPIGQISPEDLKAQYGYFGNSQQENANGYLDSLAFIHRNDTSAVPSLTQQGTARDILTGGNNGQANFGFYQTNGDPNAAANEKARLDAMGGVFGSQVAPTINTGAVDPFTGQATAAAGTMQGYGAQLGAFGTMPAGPSAAEMAMRAQGEQAQNAQASMAAGARGGNSALALQGAGANMAQISGQMNQQIGTQRAAEDLANRQFAANALSGAAGINANAAGIYGNNAGLYGGFAGQNASNQLQQTGINNQTQLAYTGMGNAQVGQQTANNIAFDQNKANNYINALRAQQGQEQINQQQQQISQAERDKWINAGVTAGTMGLSALATSGSKSAPSSGGAQPSSSPGFYRQPGF